MPYTGDRYEIAEFVMAELRTAGGAVVGAIEVNRVLRNTYLLLGLTLGFSSVVT